MKKNPFSISECFGTLFCLQPRHGLLDFHYKLSRVLWFVIHGVKYKHYKEHRVLETNSLATLYIQIESSKMTTLDFSVLIGCKKIQFFR